MKIILFKKNFRTSWKIFISNFVLAISNGDYDDFIFILTSFANNTFLARRTFYDITRHTPVITNLAADGSTSL